MTSRCLFVPSLPLEEWPQGDRDRWASALEGDSYAPGGEGGGAHWRSGTQVLVEQNYGVWLAWWRLEGELTDVANPADRATAANLRAYLKAMREAGYSGRSVATRLRGLASALGVMCPHFDAKPISRAAGRVEAKAPRVRDVRSRRFAPEDLLAYADRLMDEAVAEGVSPLDAAISFRDGLLLAFHASRALRIANLASIQIGKHLQRRGAGWDVRFEDSEMKAARRFICTWPVKLVPQLELYLGTHRQTLASQGDTQPGDPSLWLSRDGPPLMEGSVTAVIRRRTKVAFGKASGPHLMRHILATSLAEHAPQDIANVARVLGHTSLETSHQNYVHANAVQAGYLLHEAQAARLKPTEPPLAPAR